MCAVPFASGLEVFWGLNLGNSLLTWETILFPFLHFLCHNPSGEHVFMKETLPLFLSLVVAFFMLEQMRRVGWCPEGYS